MFCFLLLADGTMRVREVNRLINAHMPTGQLVGTDEDGDRRRKKAKVMPASRKKAIFLCVCVRSSMSLVLPVQVFWRSGQCGECESVNYNVKLLIAR